MVVAARGLTTAAPSCSKLESDSSVLLALDDDVRLRDVQRRLTRGDDSVGSIALLLLLRGVMRGRGGVMIRRLDPALTFLVVALRTAAALVVVLFAADFLLPWDMC